jgi:hypothetical protein
MITFYIVAVLIGTVTFEMIIWHLKSLPPKLTDEQKRILKS